ncbi:hypothetical protein BaRGS_00006811 [Batillaria attramentaria]|uniref:Uncharacterized protein n=1 Tax=Batillaria attramentaria TaxID=370345 RepID=A0ABD0LST9_9CAEN
MIISNGSHFRLCPQPKERHLRILELMNEPQKFKEKSQLQIHASDVKNALDIKALGEKERPTLENERKLPPEDAATTSFHRKGILKRPRSRAVKSGLKLPPIDDGRSGDQKMVSGKKSGAQHRSVTFFIQESSRSARASAARRPKSTREKALVALKKNIHATKIVCV